MNPARERDFDARARAGFTLIEMLIVILIVVLLSVAALPIIAPALNQRRVGDAARMINAELNRARDEAIRANAPRGFRLLPDPIDPNRPNVLTSSRMIPIELGGGYRSGVVRPNFDPTSVPPYPSPYPLVPVGVSPYLVLREEKLSTPSGIPALVPNDGTSWYFNLRQGDKLRIAGSSQEYIVAGPVANYSNAVPPGASIGTPNLLTTNPERFINFGPAWNSAPSSFTPFEFLYLVNGIDDDGDGFVDEGFDGINNDGDFYPAAHPLAGQPVIDPGFNGIDDNGDGQIDEPAEMYLHFHTGGTPVYPGIPFGGYDNGGFPPPASQYTPNHPMGTMPNEFEQESFVGIAQTDIEGYHVVRGPVVARNAQEVRLPAGVVIDLTTWNAGYAVDASGGGLRASKPERSRLPVDPYTGYVDILVAPNGQILLPNARDQSFRPAEVPYLHFWLTDVEDVHNPLWDGLTANPNDLVANPGWGLTSCAERYLLPMPDSTVGSGGPSCGGIYPPASPPAGGLVFPILQAERRLVSVNTRTGQIVTTTLENFDVNNPNRPYQDALAGFEDNP